MNGDAMRSEITRWVKRFIGGVRDYINHSPSIQRDIEFVFSLQPQKIRYDERVEIRNGARRVTRPRLEGFQFKKNRERKKRSGSLYARTHAKTTKPRQLPLRTSPRCSAMLQELSHMDRITQLQNEIENVSNGRLLV